MKLKELLDQKIDFELVLEEFPKKFLDFFKEEIEDYSTYTHNILYPENTFNLIDDKEILSDDNVIKLIKNITSRKFNMCVSFGYACSLQKEYWIHKGDLYYLEYEWDYELYKESYSDFGTHRYRLRSLDTYLLKEPKNISFLKIDLTDEIEKSKGLLFMIWEKNGFETNRNKWILPDELKRKLEKYNEKYCSFKNNYSTRQWY